MINQLRTKLIEISIACIIVVFIVLLSIAHIFSFRDLSLRADAILRVLVENRWHFPAHPMDIPEYGSITDFNFSRELPFEYRYFCVLMSDNGDILDLHMDHIWAVDESEAREYGEKVFNRKSNKGYLDKYRYVKYNDDDGIRIIFLDCHRSIMNFKMHLVTTCGVSIIGIITIFILITVFSDKIVKPFSKSYEKQKRFITDAGHAIKTPITIIDADAQVLEMEIGENEWLNEIKNQVKRISGLINDLMYLARMGESVNEIEMISFSLSDVAMETAQSFMAVAKMKKKSFNINIQPMLTYKGHQKAIVQLLSILFENAIKYSDECGEIGFSVERQGKAYLIKVVNSTTNKLTNEDLENLFERFYRCEASRKSENGGYGIGLAIAKAIVLVHNGKIYANMNDNIMEITVVLPI